MGLDLARVFQQFDPDEPLGANDPRYVDCLRERGIADLFERLKLPLDSEKPRALFAFFCFRVGACFIPTP